MFYRFPVSFQYHSISGEDCTLVLGQSRDSFNKFSTKTSLFIESPLPTGGYPLLKMNILLRNFHITSALLIEKVIKSLSYLLQDRMNSGSFTRSLNSFIVAWQSDADDHPFSKKSSVISLGAEPYSFVIFQPDHKTL